MDSFVGILTSDKLENFSEKLTKEEIAKLILKKSIIYQEKKIQCILSEFVNSRIKKR